MRNGNQYGGKSAHSQSTTVENHPPFRRVLLEGTGAQQSFDTRKRPASKKRTEGSEGDTPEDVHWRNLIFAPKGQGIQKAGSKPKLPKKAREVKLPMSGRVAFGVVATSRPTDTSLDELVRDIEPLPKAKIPGDSEIPTLLVILLTPGLARYALDGSLSEALYQRFKVRWKSELRVEATSAIVDRLPAEADKPEGSEGMAYMLFRDPPMAKLEDRTAFQQSAQKPGSLTFRLPRLALHESSPLIDYELQLPLSQTVFTTGLVSTLIHRTFAVNKPPSSPALTLLHEQNLESQTLQLPTMRRIARTQRLQMPLVPLTPFRTIEYVMGNIIRKLSAQPPRSIKAPENGKIDQIDGSEVADTSMPASEELEKSVSRYFEALDLQPETVSVWAFVVPVVPDSALANDVMSRMKDVFSADEQSITSAWHPDTEAAILLAKSVNNAIRLMIPFGARLIKVLSGGGGWGKKAGLLSLDPDVQYSTRDLRHDQGWKFDFDGVDDGTGTAVEAQKNQALGQIVKKGERIMFMLAPKPEHVPGNRTEGHDVTTNPENKDQQTTLDLAFGAIPSSIDMIPQDVASDTNVATIRHYPGRFGMLSEGGMAVTVSRTNGLYDGQSKLDVPFARWNFTHRDEYYFPFRNAAQWADLSGAGSVNSQDSAAQQNHSTKQAEQTTEPVQTERRSRDTKVADLFQSFAEHDETKDAKRTPAGLENADLDSLLTTR
jgi:hypothetical protein